MFFRTIPSDQALRKRLQYKGSKKRRRAGIRLAARELWRKNFVTMIKGFEVPDHFVDLITEITES